MVAEAVPRVLHRVRVLQAPLERAGGAPIDAIPEADIALREGASVRVAGTGSGRAGCEWSSRRRLHVAAVICEQWRAIADTATRCADTRGAERVLHAADQIDVHLRAGVHVELRHCMALTDGNDRAVRANGRIRKLRCAVPTDAATVKPADR